LHDFYISCRIFRVLSNLLVRFVNSSLGSFLRDVSFFMSLRLLQTLVKRNYCRLKTNDDHKELIQKVKK